MSTKRTAGIFGVLCGTCLVFGLMHGRTGTPAMADDGQLPVPEVQGTWQPQSLQPRPIERTRSKSDEKTPKTATKARRPVSTERPVVKDTQPVKETVAGIATRKALPWVAGTLALAGLAMVLYGLWTRRRPLPNQIARSITHLQASEAGHSNGQRFAHARLAASLMQREMPPLKVSFSDHREEQGNATSSVGMALRTKRVTMATIAWR